LKKWIDPPQARRGDAMKPVITAFRDSPDLGMGQARDMRVRWALEEVGQDYDVRLLSMTELKAPPHRRIQPFGSIPTYEDGELALFETGAIVFHIAETREGLLPNEPKARAQAITWMFAALNTVEPPIVEREAFMLIEHDKEWFAKRRPLLDDNVRKRLGELSAFLQNADWLDGEFSAADLLMVSVLRRLDASNIPEPPLILNDFPSLSDYVSRGVARPAYERAFEAQREVFLDKGRRDASDPKQGERLAHGMLGQLSTQTCRPTSTRC
jgi:glutathione S-transferase